MKHTAPILALLAITFTARAADEWTQFRGPTGQGISDAKNVPTEWSGTEHVAWTTEIPGKGWSSPVLSKGRLYLTTAIGEKGSEVSLRALCLDAKDGRILWDTEIFKPEATLSSVMHKKNSLASPSPIVTADRLYVHFGHMGTAALDLAGKIVWKQDTEAAYTPQHGAGASPALIGDALVFSCDGVSDPFVAALDAATGKLRWKTPRNSPAKTSFHFPRRCRSPSEVQRRLSSPAADWSAATIRRTVMKSGARLTATATRSCRGRYSRMACSTSVPASTNPCSTP